MEAYLCKVATLRLANDENLYFNPYQDLTYTTLDGALNGSCFQNFYGDMVMNSIRFSVPRQKTNPSWTWDELLSIPTFLTLATSAKIAIKKPRNFHHFARLHLVGDEFCLSSRSIQVVLSMHTYNLRKHNSTKVGGLLSWSPKKTSRKPPKLSEKIIFI